jgi:outer membrane protein insertion porin family
LKSGDYFNLAAMTADLGTLRDLYGSEGYIFADIEADPRFLEEPGQLDLVYNIEEGQQYRVGRIDIKIAGEYPHTRQNVVLNRISLRPGDIIDIRKVRESERRLKSSQLFRYEPQAGVEPQLVIKPPDLQKARSLAREGASSPDEYRGQSPDGETRRPHETRFAPSGPFAPRPARGPVWRPTRPHPPVGNPPFRSPMSSHDHGPPQYGPYAGRGGETR